MWPSGIRTVCDTVPCHRSYLYHSRSSMLCVYCRSTVLILGVNPMCTKWQVHRLWKRKTPLSLSLSHEVMAQWGSFFSFMCLSVHILCGVQDADWLSQLLLFAGILQLRSLIHCPSSFCGLGSDSDILPALWFVVCFFSSSCCCLIFDRVQCCQQEIISAYLFLFLFFVRRQWSAWLPRSWCRIEILFWGWVILSTSC